MTSGIDPVAELRAAVGRAVTSVRGDATPGGGEPTLERPPSAELGDFSSNAALLLAAPLGRSPREVAGQLRESLVSDLGDSAERVEIAGPGFVNLFLSDGWFGQAMVALANGGDGLRIPPVAEPERVLVEFVSANPTGPLTAASGRHAAHGDSVARLLAAAGHEVTREYYINDTGGQIERFAASIAAEMTGAPRPEDGYEGDYVGRLAAELADAGLDAGDLEAIGSAGVERMVGEIKATLHRYGADFDSWFSEASLYRSGKVDAALERLRGSGQTYESEGALWMRTSEFGDDKDRVLVRADGSPTYFGGDVAYHSDKLERGFERLVDILGADHHGYVARMRAAIACLEPDRDAFEAQMIQFVHIVEDGGRSQMSKRRGEFVSLDDLLDDIGVDATRFFMLQRSHDTTVDLDLDLARRESNDNPVYYVQYAHARIASILRKAGAEAASAARRAAPRPDAAPMEAAERDLVKRLLELPQEVHEAAARRAPHRLCSYATVVAADFHAFYRDCQVIGAPGDGVEDSRLALCMTTKQTIARTLDLLGISAPERM